MLVLGHAAEAYGDVRVTPEGTSMWTDRRGTSWAHPPGHSGGGGGGGGKALPLKPQPRLRVLLHCISLLRLCCCELERAPQNPPTAAGHPPNMTVQMAAHIPFSGRGPLGLFGGSRRCSAPSALQSAHLPPVLYIWTSPPSAFWAASQHV